MRRFLNSTGRFDNVISCHNVTDSFSMYTLTLNVAYAMYAKMSGTIK
jgi:hypothetical protein